ncbi:MAG: hypothetical protein LQ348_006829 [Seirophora lacunosa]|nr:MAG: hypothetical protein LQ348_006829 [Seirophora lacunosa]
MSPRHAIVFGPTGAVGSAAARTASQLGANVTLAMRDIQKPIPGLSDAEEKAGNFIRVQADLTKPDTVHEAVRQSQATHAFVYLVFGTSDNMKATITALKSAGIEIVVFLSSFTVRGDIDAIPPNEIISYMHAQVELSLREVFGQDKFIAIRPGSFASNLLQYYKRGFQKGHVEIYSPNTLMDYIVPKDIGRVSGTVLATGPQDDHRAIYLYGPEMMSQYEAVKIAAGVLGIDLKIDERDAQSAYKMFTEEEGMPPPLAEYLVQQLGKTLPEGVDAVFGTSIDKQDLGNVEKYSGKRATTFKQWVEDNRTAFLS